MMQKGELHLYGLEMLSSTPLIHNHERLLQLFKVVWEDDSSHHSVSHGALHLKPSSVPDSSPSASSSELLPHLTLLLTTPSKARLLNLSEELFVLGTEFLHASTLQELLLLPFFALLQDLLVRLQL